jgi:mono/diheme cytochrome c family protein
VVKNRRLKNTNNEKTSIKEEKLMRKLMFLTISVLVLALLLVGCGGGGSPAQEEPADTSDQTAPEGDAAAGEPLFQSTCAACHGPDGKGLPNLGKDFTASEFVKSQSDAELVAFVKQGRPVSDPANTTGVDMPPKGGNPALSDEDLFDIVAYIRTLQE